jgi:hypothetical protein
MCIIVYEMIDKGSIPSIETPITFQVCWKESFIQSLAFGLFGLFYAFVFFQLFLQRPKAAFGKT